MINTSTSQVFLPAKFHNFAISGLFSIHKNKRVQFLWNTVYIHTYRVDKCPAGLWLRQCEYTYDMHKSAWYVHQQQGRLASVDDKPWRNHKDEQYVGSHWERDHTTLSTNSDRTSSRPLTCQSNVQQSQATDFPVNGYLLSTRVKQNMMITRLWWLHSCWFTILHIKSQMCSGERVSSLLNGTLAQDRPFTALHVQLSTFSVLWNGRLTVQGSCVVQDSLYQSTATGSEVCSWSSPLSPP